MPDHFIEWKDDYLVGHPLIDADHQALVHITNNLFNSIQDGSAKKDIAETIRNLVDYIERHFEREENLFRGTDYPDTSSHMAMHRAIEQKVHGISDAYAGDPKSIDVEEIMAFLQTWLTDHIMRSDRTYMPFLNT